MKQKNSKIKKTISFLVLIICAVFVLGGCGSTDSNNEGTNNEKVKGSNIVQVAISNNYVAMLDNKGDLHFYGKYENGISNTDETKVIASDVKYFVSDGRFTIVKNDDTAYYTGLNIDGYGVVSDFEKVTDNVKLIASNSFCFFIVDNDNNYIVRGPLKNSNAMKYCALPEGFDGDFSKIESNVKGVEVGSFDNGYITNDNELYVSLTTKKGYKKVLSNVKKIVGKLILTEDNSLYIIDQYSDEIAKKLDEKVSDVYSTNGFYYLYKKTDGKHYSMSSLYEGDIKELEFSNIKTPYYYDGKRLVYLNTNDKLVLAGEDNNELDLSKDSIKKIYEFIQ